MALVAGLGMGVATDAAEVSPSAGPALAGCGPMPGTSKEAALCAQLFTKVALAPLAPASRTFTASLVTGLALMPMEVASRMPAKRSLMASLSRELRKAILTPM